MAITWRNQTITSSSSSRAHLCLWLLLLPLALMAVAGCNAAGKYTAASGWSGAVISGDTIYIGSRQAELLALDKENGTLRWSFPDNKDISLVGLYGSPAVSESLIYVGAYGQKKGTLYAINSATQIAEWDFPTEGHIVGAPLVAGDTVLIGSSDGNLYALDAARGFEQWRFPTGNKIWSTPVVYQNVVYFGSLDHDVYAVNLKDGSQLWSFPTRGAIASTPLIMDGRLYVGSFDHHFYALDAATGDQVWAAPFKANNWFWAQAVSDGTTIYVGSLDGNLYALNANSGLPAWPAPFETDSPIVSSPTLVPEGVVVANDKGDIFLVRTQDGKQIRSFSTKDHIRAPLTASGSIVYFSAMDYSIRAANLEGGFWRELWCYDTKESRPQCN